MGKYALEHQIIHLELPTMQKSLESCLPSSFIDKVDIITLELVLRGFVVCLNTGGDHCDF
jgi:hypothetical protein